MSSAIVQGYEQLQAARMKLVADMQPSGGLGAAVLYATQQYAAGTRGRVHVATGTYRASQTPEVKGLMGTVYTAGNRNPVSGASASVYGPVEEARGGSHAAYATTFEQDTAGIAAEAIRLIIKDLP
jgi:hypothetical protein